MIYEDYFKSVMGGDFKSPEYYNTYENKTYEPIQVNGPVDNTNDVMDLYPDIYKVVLPMIDKMLLEKNTSNLNENTLNTWTLEIYDSLEAEDNVKQPNNQVYESETTSAKPIKVDNRTNLNQSANINTTTKLNQTANTNNITSLNTTNLNQNKIASNNPLKSVNNYVKNDRPINSSNNYSIETNAENLKENKTIDVVSRYQNRKNPILRDLIKIMILNRLFGNNNNNRLPRPPYPNFNYNPPRPNNPRPNYRETSISTMENYSPVDANPYSKYLKNPPKTYFDTPYPEEG